jgi:hypothetical protein
MRDAEDGKLLWQSGEWGRRMLHEEMEARVTQVNGFVKRLCQPLRMSARPSPTVKCSTSASCTKTEHAFSAAAELLSITLATSAVAS